MNKKFGFSLVIVAVILLASIFTYQSVYSVSKPAVHTADANISENSIDLRGMIKDTGGGKIIGYGFKWGTSKDLKHKKSLGKNIKVNTAFTAVISELKPGTTYYYQAYASNSKGFGYGEIKSFTTPHQHNDIPTVTFSQPSGNITVAAGDRVTISANARDDVDSMELLINNAVRSRVNKNSVSLQWDTSEVSAGEYKVKAIAWDGNSSGEKTITIWVKKANANSTAGSATSRLISSASRGSTLASRYSTASARYPLLSKVNGSFGQFAYRNLSGGRIEVDPKWTANNIVTVTLPGLNQQVQVNRAARDNFIYAFNLIKNGTAVVNGRRVSLLSLIYTMDGTFVTRHVNWDPSRGLSNHSWGTAIDINADGHFGYVDSSDVNDPNLILWEKAFKPAGFSWGNRYGDSMHFELIK